MPVAITSEIRGRFGDDVCQIKSGCSLVLISERNLKIFKTSFDVNENSKLNSYVNTKPFEESTAKDYVCFPINAIHDMTFKFFFLSFHCLIRLSPKKKQNYISFFFV